MASSEAKNRRKDWDEVPNAIFVNKGEVVVIPEVVVTPNKEDKVKVKVDDHI